jgi:succinate-semialdehyde dehydrogenase/glutarate-semialdehyde dehydrogenase
VAELIKDPRIAAVTLTGSEAAGKSVARAAGEALKKSVLELGGSDPFIVLEDADLAIAVPAALANRMQNVSGQSCIAAKRFIVVDSIADTFVAQLKSLFENLTMGDPFNATTQVGPLATDKILAEIERQVDTSVAQGAVVVTGGKRMGNRGYFYSPTILDYIQPAMPVYTEETFGPVAAVIRVANAAQALQIANDTTYGLGASIWTANTEAAKQYATRIQAGCVFVNGKVKSDARLPFGGIKRSGYGRELSSFGIREFVNVKTVWVG